MSSNMLGYATLISSVSTVSKVKPALPIKLDTSLVSIDRENVRWVSWVVV